LSSTIDPLKRDRWARLRFSIIGPLLAAPPAAGELQAALTLLAVKRWRHPLSGLEVCFGKSTLERWYYRHGALPTRSPRSETGCAATSAVSPA
jgi:putative transposase